MRIVRSYPDPDPILRFLDQEAIPQSVWALEPQERAQRIRYALICMCAGLHPLVAWATALDDDTPQGEAAIEDVLSRVTDADIEQMVRDSRREARAGLS